MNMKERMLAGLPYKAWLDGLSEDRLVCKRLLYDYNNSLPDDEENRRNILEKLFGKINGEIFIEPPFHCDYGSNIGVGERFYANYNLTILDVNKVKIGRCCFIAPNVTISTAGHPVHPETRNTGYEYGIEINIGDNVWIGAGAIVLPGVTIGSNSVIGAGSIVTKDIPESCIAAGNPARIIRQITENDRDFYFKDRKFDIQDYK